MSYMEKLGEAPDGMPFGAYDNLDISVLDLEAGFPVTKIPPGMGEIYAGLIPEGKFISTIHIGAYGTLAPAYDAPTILAAEHGFIPSGEAYEYFLNDPNEGPGGIAETEIRFPLK